MTSYMKTIIFILVTLTLFSLFGNTPKAAELKKVSLRLQWVPQSQFAGYYVALKKGYYTNQGIDLDIRPGGPRISPGNTVASGQETFGTAWLSSGITLASQGAPIVNIAQMIQTSGLMMLSLKKNGIDHPKKMHNRKVGVWSSIFFIPPSMLIKKFSIRPKLIRQGFSMKPFIDGEIEVASAMIHNEYHVVLESGVRPDELNTFYFRDYGLDFPEDGIYVHRDTLAKDSDLCRKFVKASIQGWRYAFENEDEAVSIVMKEAMRAKTGTTLIHQKTMLDEIKKLMLFQVGIDGIGELNPKAFEFVKKVLNEHGKKSQSVTFQTFHQPLY